MLAWRSTTTRNVSRLHRSTVVHLINFFCADLILISSFFACFAAVNIPLMLQPHAYGSLCAIIFVQMLYYDRKWSVLHSLGALAFYAIAGGGFEVGMYFACLVSITHLLWSYRITDSCDSAPNRKHKAMELPV
jgi:succinate dehydrogenase/fumarate reductase cytochrome b subunit